MAKYDFQSSSVDALLLLDLVSAQYTGVSFIRIRTNVIIMELKSKTIAIARLANKCRTDCWCAGALLASSGRLSGSNNY